MDETKTLIRELHRPAHKPKVFRKVTTNGIDDCWGVDLADMQRYAAENDGFKYWFVCEDIFSRYCWVVPLKDKTAKATWDAFESVIRELRGEWPARIWADSGKEWYNNYWKPNLPGMDIDLYTTYSEVGVAPVERLIKTLKHKQWPLFEEQGSARWIELLPRVVAEYNNTVHSALKMTPLEARDPHGEARLWHYQYDDAVGASDPKPPRFRVGDWVRTSVVKGTFERGWQPNWSHQPYRIAKVLLTNPVTYILRDRPTARFRDGEIVKGSFYDAELEPTAVPDAGFVDVTEEKVEKGVKMVKLHWRGVDKKYDSWERAAAVRTLGKR